MLLVAAPLLPPTSNLPSTPSSALASEPRIAQMKEPLVSTPRRFAGTTRGLLRIRSMTLRDTPNPHYATKKEPLDVEGKETCTFLQVKCIRRLKSTYFALAF